MLKGPDEARKRTADEALKAALSTRLTELTACAGKGCREVEDAPVRE